jgi:hypothetical protein
MVVATLRVVARRDQWLQVKLEVIFGPSGGIRPALRMSLPVEILFPEKVACLASESSGNQSSIPHWHWIDMLVCLAIHIEIRRWYKQCCTTSKLCAHCKKALRRRCRCKT